MFYANSAKSEKNQYMTLKLLLFVKITFFLFFQESNSSTDIILCKCKIMVK